MRISDFCQYFAALTIAAAVHRVAEILRSVFIAGALPQKKTIIFLRQYFSRTRRYTAYRDTRIFAIRQNMINCVCFMH